MNEYPKLLTLRCIVDAIVVDVRVCWSADQVAAVVAKWPDGVDVATIASPDYEGLGTAQQMQWLARAARRTAQLDLRSGKSQSAPKPEIIKAPQSAAPAASSGTGETHHGNEEEEDRQGQEID